MPARWLKSLGCKKLNYTGPIDKDTFESDYEEGKTPELSAAEFVKEMNEN